MTLCVPFWSGLNYQFEKTPSQHITFCLDPQVQATNLLLFLLVSFHWILHVCNSNLCSPPLLPSHLGAQCSNSWELHKTHTWAKIHIRSAQSARCWVAWQMHPISPLGFFNMTTRCISVQLRAVNHSIHPGAGESRPTWVSCSSVKVLSLCSTLSSASRLPRASWRWTCVASRARFSAVISSNSCCKCASSSLAAVRSSSTSRFRSLNSALSASTLGETLKVKGLCSGTFDFIWTRYSWYASIQLNMSMFWIRQFQTCSSTRFNSTLSFARPSLKAPILAKESLSAAASLCSLVSINSCSAFWASACLEKGTCKFCYTAAE